MQTAMRAAFLDLAATHSRFRVIDGAPEADTVARDVLSIAQSWLQA